MNGNEGRVGSEGKRNQTYLQRLVATTEDRDNELAPSVVVGAKSDLLGPPRLDIATVVTTQDHVCKMMMMMRKRKEP